MADITDEQVFQFLKDKGYSKPPQSTMGAIGEGLGSLVLGNQVAQGAAQNRAGTQQQIDSLANMYGPNSPYATQLRQALARKDAAAGRNSQYGPREVELQARLAGLQGQNAATIGNLQNQQQKANVDETQVRAQQLAHLFNIADKTGAANWAGSQLGNMFGEQTPVNQPMNQSVYAGGGDYSGWSPGQTYQAPEQPYQSNQGMGQMYGPEEQSAYTPQMDQSQAPTSSNNSYYMDWME